MNSILLKNVQFIEIFGPFMIFLNLCKAHKDCVKITDCEHSVTPHADNILKFSIGLPIEIYSLENVSTVFRLNVFNFGWKADVFRVYAKHAGPFYPCKPLLVAEAAVHHPELAGVAARVIYLAWQDKEVRVVIGKLLVRDETYTALTNLVAQEQNRPVTPPGPEGRQSPLRDIFQE